MSQTMAVSCVGAGAARVRTVWRPGSCLRDRGCRLQRLRAACNGAQAARNTKVRFIVLKDGLLNRGQSLGRARNPARGDLSLTG